MSNGNRKEGIVLVFRYIVLIFRIYLEANMFLNYK